MLPFPVYCGKYKKEKTGRKLRQKVKGYKKIGENN